MRFFIVVACLSLSQAAVIHLGDHASKLSGQELVDYINKVQNLFKAELAPADHALHTKLMKREFAFRNRSYAVVREDPSDVVIPESFDGRKVWSYCPSLSYIRDQANCGSCWAVASAATMSDRMCVASQGRYKVEISASELISCCKDCGYGCEGGYPLEAWYYFEQKGIVTGGNYGTKDACKPYPFHPCGHHANQPYYGECEEKNKKAPQCVEECQSGYGVSFEKDKLYGQWGYRVANSVPAIQKEIMKYGPVIATFEAFEDIEHYKSGIYKHTAGQSKGSHTVKIIGWGTENGVPYWLIANSWNTDWGENGFFRMIRGEDHCGIESLIEAGSV